MKATELLALIRELYSRSPEISYLLAWELQHVLFSLEYVDDLVDEAVIEAARDVALSDFDPNRRAA